MRSHSIYYHKFQIENMQVQAPKVPENATIAFELKKCAVHRLFNKQKEKIAEGSCKIYSSLKQNSETPDQQYDSYYIKVKDFVLPIVQNMNFATINYPQTTSYLFENNDTFIYSFSFNKNCQNLSKFESQLERLTVVTEFSSDSLKPELKQKINEASDAKIETQEIWNEMGYVKMIGNNVGIFVGKVTNYVSQPLSSTGKVFSERADRFSRESVSEETKSKWNNITQKTSNINQSMGTAMRPVINTYENFAEYLGKSFNESENKFISSIRQYSYALRDSLNEGESKTINKQQSANLQQPEQSSQVQLHEIGQ